MVELKEKLNQEDLSLPERIRLQGELLECLKNEYKKATDPNEKARIRLEYDELLEKHKETIKERRKDKSIRISERLALKIREIATSIKIFNEKHDIIGKAKAAGINAGISALTAGAFTIGIAIIGGAPITLPLLASALPVMSYCGLTGFLRMPFIKTQWSKIMKEIESREGQKGEEIKQFLEDTKNNTVLQELLLKYSQTPPDLEYFEICEKLVNEYQKIIEKAPTDDFKKSFVFEKINVLTSWKKRIESIEFAAIRGNIKLSEIEKLEFEKAKKEIDMKIKKEYLFTKEVLKETTKSLGISTGCMVAAKAILGTFFPSYAITDLASLGWPLIVTGIQGLRNSQSIRRALKLELEQYNRLKIKIEKEKLKELINTKSNKTENALTM